MQREAKATTLGTLPTDEGFAPGIPVGSASPTQVERFDGDRPGVIGGSGDDHPPLGILYSFEGNGQQQRDHAKRVKRLVIVTNVGDVDGDVGTSGH